MKQRRDYWLEMHFEVYCGPCTPFLFKKGKVNSWSWCRAIQRLLDKEICPKEAYYNQFKMKGQENAKSNDKRDHLQVS